MVTFCVLPFLFYLLSVALFCLLWCLSSGTVGGYDGFSSHPYALALDSSGGAGGGGYVIGGHVVFDDPAIHKVERCQGRMIRVDATVLPYRYIGSQSASQSAGKQK
jgi:hypothetical protein